jgi:hypothetical protein
MLAALEEAAIDQHAALTVGEQVARARNVCVAPKKESCIARSILFRGGHFHREWYRTTAGNSAYVPVPEYSKMTR